MLGNDGGGGGVHIEFRFWTWTKYIAELSSTISAQLVDDWKYL